MKKANEKYLQEYEGDMITALFYQYTRQMPKTVLIKMDEIYLEETGDSLDTNYSCSHCVLFLVGKIGKLYFTAFPERLPEDLQSKFTPIKK